MNRFLIRDEHQRAKAERIMYKYKEKYMMLREEFEEKCWKLSTTNAQGVEWIKNPWPWEKEGCDC